MTQHHAWDIPSQRGTSRSYRKRSLSQAAEAHHANHTSLLLLRIMSTAITPLRRPMNPPKRSNTLSSTSSSKEAARQPVRSILAEMHLNSHHRRGFEIKPVESLPFPAAAHIIAVPKHVSADDLLSRCAHCRNAMCFLSVSIQQSFSFSLTNPKLPFFDTSTLS